MVVVGVYDFATPAIELEDGVVGHAGDEFVGLGGIEFDYVRYLAIAKLLQCFAGFGVPEQNLSIVSRR